MRSRKILKWVLIFSVLVLLAVLYTVFNPAESNFFPKCPFRLLTGLQCPGCGSQRAVHHLLNGDIPGAFGENAIMVLSIPYLITGFGFDMIRSENEKYLKWRKRLFGSTAIYIILGIIIVFTVLRNIC